MLNQKKRIKSYNMNEGETIELAMMLDGGMSEPMPPDMNEEAVMQRMEMIMKASETDDQSTAR